MHKSFMAVNARQENHQLAKAESSRAMYFTRANEILLKAKKAYQSISED